MHSLRETQGQCCYYTNTWNTKEVTCYDIARSQWQITRCKVTVSRWHVNVHIKPLMWKCSFTSTPLLLSEYDYISLFVLECQNICYLGKKGSSHQQLLTMNTEGYTVGSMRPIQIPERSLGATLLRMYSQSPNETLTQRCPQETAETMRWQEVVEGGKAMARSIVNVVSSET